jgi:alpha-N-arabinofuranosidase
MSTTGVGDAELLQHVDDDFSKRRGSPKRTLWLKGRALFLSDLTLVDMSQGGAFAHNLFAGEIQQEPETTRVTPFHEAHSTRITGRTHIDGGDNRFYNNVFVGPADLGVYDDVARPVQTGGNVFLNGASPTEGASDPLVAAKFAPGLELTETSGHLRLRVRVDPVWEQDRERRLVTTELLGRAEVTGLPYEQPDGSALQIDTDYGGRSRNAGNPFPGPFARPALEDATAPVWPK